jgi:hypothetical protein
VGVDQRLVAGQFHHQAVPRLEGVRERVQAHHVLVDLPGLDREGAGVRVIRVALGGAIVELAVRGFEVTGRDELPGAAGSLVPQAQDKVRVIGVDLDEEVSGTGADHLFVVSSNGSVDQVSISTLSVTVSGAW